MLEVSSFDWKNNPPPMKSVAFKNNGDRAGGRNMSVMPQNRLARRETVETVLVGRSVNWKIQARDSRKSEGRRGGGLMIDE